MELALIPPMGLLDYGFSTKYQLMLPHMLRNEKYAEFYYNLCLNHNRYVILDNGAAEQISYSGHALAIVAQQYLVDEMVVPDVLGDCDATIAKAVEFATMWRNHISSSNNRPFKLGFVAQGTNVVEAVNCAISMGHISRVRPLMDVLYIPRLLVSSKEPHARLHVAAQLRNHFGPDMPIHFLGASAIWPEEILHAANFPANIRSIDTSMPFVFAQEPYLGRVDHRETWTRIPHRTDDTEYWDHVWTERELEVVKHNVRVLSNWARGIA
jgi:hypothetical protein